MELTLKYHGELTEYFPDDSGENMIKLNVDDGDSVFSIIEKFKIPREKISLVLVNGIKVNNEDCDSYHFTDGDTLAVWPISS